MIKNNTYMGHALRITVGIMMLGLLLASVGLVQAEIQKPLPPELGLSDSLQMPGILEANGTHFEMNNSEYLNITLDSSEAIKLILESVPEMVTMYIESDSGATSTQIKLSSFLPLTTYHKYEDNYHNHTAFTADANGSYTYTQDLSNKHLVFIQPRPSTRFINDNATGGDCTSIGIWDATINTCTLTTDLAETIQIDSNGVTLDGNGHTITGSDTGNGVYLSSRTGVIIKNLNIKQFSNGIGLWYSNNNILSDNSVSNNQYGGIFLRDSDNNILTGNKVSSNSGRLDRNIGIKLEFSDNNILSGNNASNNLFAGILLFYSSNNILRGNNASNNQYYGEYGIYLGLSNNNILIGNNANSNVFFGLSLERSSNNNSIYHNNLINNTMMFNAYDTGLNQWDNGSEGNYYSDYTDTDSNSDGIGDTPYPIPGGSSVDRYPLMKPYTGEPPISNIQDKSLLQVESQPEVYWFQNGKLYWITNWNIINQMSSVPGWESVKTLPESSFNPANYPQGSRFISIGSDSEGLLIRQAGDYMVYRIEGGKKRHITYPDVMDLKGYSFDDVIDVSPTILDMFPLGDPIGIEVDLYFNKKTSSLDISHASQFTNGEVVKSITETAVAEDYTVETYVKMIKPDGTAKYAYHENSDFLPTDSLLFSDTERPLYPGTWQAQTKTWDWDEYSFIGNEMQGVYTWEFWYKDTVSGKILGEDVQGYEFIKTTLTATELNQNKSDGTTPIATGATTNEKTVIFKGKVSDPDGDNVKLQIELRRNDEYNNNFDENQGGLKNSSLVTSGSEVSISVSDLIDGNYYWRARAIDEHENKGEWKEFWDNPTGDADFVVNTAIPLPDLTVTDIKFSKDNPVEGEPITIKATIKNIGNADAKGDIKIYFSQESHYTNFNDGENGRNFIFDNPSISEIKAGEIVDVETIWNAATVLTDNPDGFINITVDALNNIAETNEENNKKYDKVTVSSQNNKFSVMVDGYHFKNFDPTTEQKKYMLKEAKSYIDLILTPWNFVNDFLLFIDSGGVCYGLASTSILYKQELIPKPGGTDTTFLMNKNDPDVSTNILRYHALQATITLYNTLAADLTLIDKPDLKSDYNGFTNYIKNKGPVLLNVKYDTGGGHSVTAYDVYESDSIKNIIVYDSNFPGMSRIIQVDLNKNDIIYNQLDDNNFYQKAKYVSVQVPVVNFGDFGYMFRHINNKIIKYLFDSKQMIISVLCPVSVTIKDQYGRIINDKGINEIPDAYVDSELKIFRLPTNLDYSVSIDADDEGNFSIILANPLTRESVTITSFNDILINKNTKAVIDIHSSNLNYVMNIDYDGDGTTDKIKEPDTAISTIDVEPPITTALMSGTLGSNEWYISNVLVNLTATDNVGGSGVNKTEYSFDNTTWITYNANFTVTNEGTTRLYYRSIDNVSNIEPTKNQTIKIDKTSPNITISGVTEGSYYNYNVTPVIIIADANLGTQSITLNGAPFVSGTLVSSEGSYMLVASATDLAGNNASETLKFTIDKTSPEASIRFNITSKDLILYNKEIGSQASYIKLPTKKGKDGKEMPDDDGEAGWELRQYTLKDLANNSLVLVLEHKKRGNEAMVKVISVQYNSGKLIKEVKNKIQVQYSAERNGALKELQQDIEVKKLFNAEAKYSAKKGKTEIKVDIEGQKERKETRKGIVILELLTDKGGLKLRY